MGLFVSIDLMFNFLTNFGMHGYACVFLVLLLSWAWVFPGVTMFLSLAFPFLNNHGVMGSPVLVDLYYWMDSKLSEVDL